MKKIPATLMCLLVTVLVFAQRTIIGSVVNVTTGAPVAGSSVFVSGTSVGTSSDQSGKFQLNDVPAGRYDLIISSIGYETNVFGFTTEQLPLRVKVEMAIKVKELPNVIVEPSVEEGWDKWGQTFRDYFIGYTPNAMNCDIKNEKAIRFRFYKKSNRVIAYCDEPVLIENKALGYTIHYQLEDFEVDFKGGASRFAGYPFFEDMDKGRKGLQRRWQRARDKAFYGSMMHFMRCLYNDSLLESGYEVRRMKRVQNEGKERVRKLYRQRFAADSVSPKPGTQFFSDRYSNDSTEYYERILRQPDYQDFYSKDNLTADSLIVEEKDGYKALYFIYYLSVMYKNAKEDKAFLTFHHETRKSFYQRSLILLPNLV
ncbi:MAG: carboxypeptidase-like regulatory domain-containing protein, partial [Chitinophagaceae bacterium]